MPTLILGTSVCTAITRALLGFTLLILTACQSTTPPLNTGPLLVGPGSQTPLGTTEKVYPYPSNIFLDIAIPVFDPGFPKHQSGEIDYQKIKQAGIWPQLRRAEAKRFAVSSKKALDNIPAFGAVSVVPSPNTSADLYILGKINHSDSQLVSLTATVIDSTGSIWGEKQFRHTVSDGFFRDSKNNNADPYQPIFNQLADYVYSLLLQQSETDKTRIQQTSLLRYAQTYSPETFSPFLHSHIVNNHIGQQPHWRHNLTGFPNEKNRMLARIQALRIHDQLFIDKLQDHYLQFDADTTEPYRIWQREALTERIIAAEVSNKGVQSGLLSGAMILGGILLDKNSQSSSGQIGKFAALLGATYFAAQSLERNAELKIHKATIDEMGESLDVTLSPSVIALDNKTIELTGTSAEQYQQWKAHLLKIYQVETANDNQPL